MLNICVCCGKEIPEGRQVCMHCEHDASIPVKKKDYSILIKIARITISAVIVVLALISLCSCDDESANDKRFDDIGFTCIWSNISGDHIYCFDNTGALYIVRDGSWGFPLIKEDGTAYTLEDYTKDKTAANKFRQDH
jgi:hypothetical protein